MRRMKFSEKLPFILKMMKRQRKTKAGTTCTFSFFHVNLKALGTVHENVAL